MWTNGLHCREITKSVNDELLELKGVLDDHTARVTFAKFLKSNPTFAIQLLMGIELYPFQHMIIKSMYERDFFLEVCSRGFSKSFGAALFIPLYAIFNPGVKIGICSQCLDKEDYIFTEDGMVKIGDCRVGSKTASIKTNNLILDKWENPPEDGRRIFTKRGYNFAGKNGHKNYVFNSQTLELELRNIEDIKKSNLIAIRLGSDLWGSASLSSGFKPENLHYHTSKIDIQDSKDLFRLMGLYMGDGSSFDTGRFTITSNDEEILDFSKKYLSDLAPDHSIEDKPKKKNSKTRDITLNSRYFYEFLRYLDFNKSATQKSIPSLILQSSRENIIEFLRGWFDTDGSFCLQTNKKTLSRSGIIQMATSSYEAAKQLQILLCNFGIVSSLTKEKARGKIKICGVDTIGKESFKVRITNLYGVRKFNDLIGFGLTRKRNQLSLYLSKYTNGSTGFPIPGVGAYLKKRYPRSLKQLFENPETHLRDNLEPRSVLNLLSKNKDLNILDDADVDKLKFLTEIEWAFDPVVKNQKIKSRSIDITVDNEKCYVANGTVAHNTFRQSRAVFKQIEDFIKAPKGKFLAQCLTGKPTHNADAWEMSFGASKVVALPLGDGGKIRGYRFNVIFIDEMLLLSEQIVNEVLRPFLAVNIDPVAREKVRKALDVLIASGDLKEEDRAKYEFPTQKLICLSSASYKFEYLYKMYEEYKQKITLPKEKTGVDYVSHCIFQLSYKMAPRGLMNEEQIKEAKSSMSVAQFGREFEAQFSDDAAGFFSPLKMKEATVLDGQYPCTKITGDKDKKYILAIDPNYSDSEASDHFAMAVGELNENDRTITLVHGYALSKSNIASRAKYVKYLFDYFNIVLLVLDNAGGAKFIEDIQEMPCFKESGLKIKPFEADFENDDYAVGLEVSKSSYSLEEGKIYFCQNFSSNWIRFANELLQGGIENRRLKFASTPLDVDFDFQLKSGIPISDIDFDLETPEVEEGKLAEFIEHQKFILDLTKTECALIEVKTSADGRQTFDLPQNLRRNNSSSPERPRKDSYTALMLLNWGAKCYFDMAGYQIKKNSGFVPSFLV